MFLEVKDLRKEYDGVVANDGISLGLEKGEIVGLIGPNGAGKTTLFNCIAGYHKPTDGIILFKGNDITYWPAHKTARAGIGRTFQIMRIMKRLTVEENVMIGAFSRIGDREKARKAAQEILELLDLKQAANVWPTELPIAIQKRVELARTLATTAELLLLDEIAAGLNAMETAQMIKTLRGIYKEKNLTLLLTEHVMDFIMKISDRIIVMAAGRKIAEGAPEEIAGNEEVIKAYLGERFAKSR